MTPGIEKAFDGIKRQYGGDTIGRVERMLHPRNQERHPMQADAKYVLPGISKRPWHDPYEHPSIQPIVKRLEEQHGAIQAEYNQLWQRGAPGLRNYEHYLMTREDWKAFYIYRRGALTRESADLTPVTHRIVKEACVDTEAICPLLESHFSTLKPGASIPPHCDLWNFSINLHLAVDIPPGCAIRVAGEERTWQTGKCMLFDYSFTHEAWNKSDRPRTCLLLDLWHPEVTVPERRALVALITEIRTLSGEAPPVETPARAKWSPWRMLSLKRT
jgi:aspartyl/asparaginyl beta-hydroxylase (cupin superfamily)